MSAEYEVTKTYEIAGVTVTSEIVRDSVSQYERLQRDVLIRSSCESKRWGTRTRDHSYGSPANWPSFPDELERMRREAAETLVKIESGEISDRVIAGLGAQIIGPTGKQLNAFCNTTFAIPHSLLAPELIGHLELVPTGNHFYEEVQGGGVNCIAIFSGKVRFGDIEVETTFLPSNHNGPMVLGGHFHQIALQGKEERISDLLMPDHIRVLASAARCKKKFVLITGKYGEHRVRLERIKAALKGSGLSGLILDEYPDIEEQSLADKMVTFASISKFVIVDDFVPSGHISELDICHERRFITAVLRQKGRAATAMQADMSLAVDFLKVVTYENEVDFDRAVLDAASWAHDTVEQKSRDLNRLYSSWRTPEKIMR